MLEAIDYKFSDGTLATRLAVFPKDNTPFLYTRLFLAGTYQCTIITDPRTASWSATPHSPYILIAVSGEYDKIIEAL